MAVVDWGQCLIMRGVMVHTYTALVLFVASNAT